MSTATLTIDLGAIVRNWHALDRRTSAQTAAVVKADAYGLGAAKVAPALAEAGARNFFIAVAEEAKDLRKALGDDPTISIFSGHMAGDTDLIRDLNLTPMINSPGQLTRHLQALPGHPFGLQLDTGMNRLGIEPDDWMDLRDQALGENPSLIMSHLACADEPDHPMNAQQLCIFNEMVAGVDVPLSFANTGAVLLDSNYHFDLIRPGVGVYGGLPFEDAEAVVSMDIPVIQCRPLENGETVGYGNTYVAKGPRRIATVSAGYADGIIRAMGPKTVLWAGDVKCPIAGRISMDLIGVDITELAEDPETLSLLGPHQTVDDLANAAGTIGYEILASLGARYTRQYIKS